MNPNPTDDADESLPAWISDVECPRCGGAPAIAGWTMDSQQRYRGVRCRCRDGHRPFTWVATAPELMKPYVARDLLGVCVGCRRPIFATRSPEADAPGEWCRACQSRVEPNNKAGNSPNSDQDE